MGAERRDKWRSAELVLTMSSRGVVGSVFAVEHDRGRQGRRLLAREILGPRDGIESVDGLVEAMRSCLDQWQSGQMTPPR